MGKILVAEDDLVLSAVLVPVLVSFRDRGSPMEALRCRGEYIGGCNTQGRYAESLPAGAGGGAPLCKLRAAPVKTGAENGR